MKKNVFTFTLFAFQIILFFDFTSSVKYECNPELGCKKYNVGDGVIDPSDCHSYFKCLRDAEGNLFPSDVSFKCEDGYYFYANLCRPGSCKSSCKTLCQTECSEYNFERVANLQDCSSFFLCQPGGKREHYRCPDSKPYFDGYQCSDNKFVCCQASTECTAFCEDDFIQIPDPYDCRSYYFCSHVGAPTVEDRYTCNEGEYFEPYLARCTTEPFLEGSCKPKCSTEYN